MLAFSAILWRRAKIIAVLLMLFSWCSLLLLSLPVVSFHLFQWLEAPYLEASYKTASTDKALDVDAVVILGAGRQRNSPEYEADQVSYHSLWRLRYGASLAKQLQLPVIVSGGLVRSYETISEAAIGAKVLSEELGVTDIMLEEQSRNTWQNAQYTATLLEEKEFENVILVTHAYHMRRAELAFAHFDLKVTPMPTGFFSEGGSKQFDDWLPGAPSLQRSRIALHEYIGLLVYRFKRFYTRRYSDIVTSN